MGYLTDHELSTFPHNKAAMNELKTQSGYEWDGDSLIGFKWYTKNEDVKSVSKMFPDTVFEIDCAGEDQGDMYRVYAKNGQLKTVNVTISWDPVPDFDV